MSPTPDIADIPTPDLVGLINAQVPQKIRIDLMPREKWSPVVGQGEVEVKELFSV
jgi:hypothetical protein